MNKGIDTAGHGRVQQQMRRPPSAQSAGETVLAADPQAPSIVHVPWVRGQGVPIHRGQRTPRGGVRCPSAWASTSIHPAGGRWQWGMATAPQGKAAWVGWGSWPGARGRCGGARRWEPKRSFESKWRRVSGSPRGRPGRRRARVGGWVAAALVDGGDGGSDTLLFLLA